MNIPHNIDKLRLLGIDLRQVIFEGSSALGIMGIIDQKDVRDLDMLVRSEVYDHAKTLPGWHESVHEVTGDTRLQDPEGLIDMWKVWFNSARRQTFEEQVSSTHRINGFRVACIQDVAKHKKARMHDRDKTHLAALFSYYAQHPEYSLRCLAARALHEPHDTVLSLA